MIWEEIRWKQWSRATAAMLLLCLCGGLQQVHAVSEKKLNLYAVIVGVTQFQDSSIPTLKLSAKDATDFYTFLKEREQLFGKAHLTLLLNEKATRANITEALRNKLKTAGKDDIVIIYLSGHGAIDAAMANEFYFVTYDASRDNLFGTALLMNDRNLFKGIASDKCVLIADACHSGGFTGGLDREGAKSIGVLPLFHGVQGRLGIASSRPEQLSYERPIFGNSVFTHFLLKGLRGDAAKGTPSAGIVTTRSLYDYVSKQTNDATEGQQSPQIYNAGGGNDQAPIFVIPKFDQPLKMKVQFQYEDDQNKVRQLTNDSVLKNGQHVGITFRPETDCYVYILWWDSSGNVGRLFPNPKLTEGTGHVRANETYWLPSMEGERWYVLDDKPGDETIYLVASRTKNPKLENLYDTLRNMTVSARQGSEGKSVTGELEREINLMGFADFTAHKAVGSATSETRKGLFETMSSEIKVAGAESMYWVRFKHESR